MREHISSLARSGKLFENTISNLNTTIEEIEQSERVFAELNPPPPSTSFEEEDLDEVDEEDSDQADEEEDLNMPPKKARGGGTREDSALEKKTEPAKGKKAAATKKVTFAVGPEAEAGPSTNSPISSPIGDVITARASPYNSLETDSGTPNQYSFTGPETPSRFPQAHNVSRHFNAASLSTPNLQINNPFHPFSPLPISSPTPALPTDDDNSHHLSLWPELARIPVSDPDDVRLRGDDPAPVFGYPPFFADAVSADPRFCTEDERLGRAIDNTGYNPERPFAVAAPAASQQQQQQRQRQLTAAEAAVAAYQPDPTIVGQYQQQQLARPEVEVAAPARGGGRGRARGTRGLGGRASRGGRGGTKKGKGVLKGDDAGAGGAMQGQGVAQQGPSQEVPVTPQRGQASGQTKGNGNVGKDSARMDVDDDVDA